MWYASSVSCVICQVVCLQVHGYIYCCWWTASVVMMTVTESVPCHWCLSDAYDIVAVWRLDGRHAAAVSYESSSLHSSSGLSTDCRWCAINCQLSEGLNGQRHILHKYSWVAVCDMKLFIVLMYVHNLLRYVDV